MKELHFLVQLMKQGEVGMTIKSSLMHIEAGEMTQIIKEYQVIKKISRINQELAEHETELKLLHIYIYI